MPEQDTHRTPSHGSHCLRTSYNTPHYYFHYFKASVESYKLGLPNQIYDAPVKYHSRDSEYYESIDTGRSWHLTLILFRNYKMHTLCIFPDVTLFC